MKVAIGIDRWKLPVFKKHLDGAGYAFEELSGVTPESLLLKVETDMVNALGVVVAAAQRECAGN